MSAPPKPPDYPSVMASIGLGQPISRAFVAAVATASLFYLTSFPKDAFREDGTCRPFALFVPGPDSVTGKHFLVAPLIVGATVFLVT